MALKMSFRSCWPPSLVRNLKSTAAKPTPHPVTVAYSAVVAPASSRMTANDVFCMTSPDCWPGPFDPGEFPDRAEVSPPRAPPHPGVPDRWTTRQGPGPVDSCRSLEQPHRTEHADHKGDHAEHHEGRQEAQAQGSGSLDLDAARPRLHVGSCAVAELVGQPVDGPSHRRPGLVRTPDGTSQRGELGMSGNGAPHLPGVDPHVQSMVDRQELLADGSTQGTAHRDQSRLRGGTGVEAGTEQIDPGWARRR